MSVARQWLRINAVDPVNAHDLFNKVCLPVDIRTPGGNKHIHDIASSLGLKAELVEYLQARVERHFNTGQAGDFRQRKADSLAGGHHIIGDDRLRRHAAAQVGHQMGRQFHAVDHEGRIHTALETITCIGDNTQVASGAGDIGCIPQG